MRGMWHLKDIYGMFVPSAIGTNNKNANAKQHGKRKQHPNRQAHFDVATVCMVRCFQRTAVRTPSGAWEKCTASEPVTVSSTYSHIQPEVSNKTQISLLNRYFVEIRVPNSAGWCATWAACQRGKY